MKKSRLFLQYTLILGCLFGTLQSSAATPRALMNMKTWPSTLDLLELAESPKEEFGNDIEGFEENLKRTISIFRSSNSDTILTSLDEELPKLIAGLEFNFPGAIFAGVGRDTRLLTEAIAMFYHSIGQPERTSWIPVSTKLVDASKDQNLYDLAKQKGLEKALTENRPYVLFDLVNSNGKQPRRIAQVAYAKLQGEGLDAAELRKQIFVVGLLNSSLSGNCRLNLSGIEPILETQNTKKDFNYRTSTIPYVDGAKNQCFALGYGPAWHKKFFSWASAVAGNMVPTLPQLNSAGERATYLYFGFRIRNMVQNPNFLERVDTELAKLGYKGSIGDGFTPIPTANLDNYLKDLGFPQGASNLAQISVELKNSPEKFKDLWDDKSKFLDFLLKLEKEDSMALLTLVFPFLDPEIELQNHPLMPAIKTAAKTIIPKLELSDLAIKIANDEKLLVESLQSREWMYETPTLGNLIAETYFSKKKVLSMQAMEVLRLRPTKIIGFEKYLQKIRSLEEEQLISIEPKLKNAAYQMSHILDSFNVEIAPSNIDALPETITPMGQMLLDYMDDLRFRKNTEDFIALHIAWTIRELRQQKKISTFDIYQALQRLFSRPTSPTRELMTELIENTKASEGFEYVWQTHSKDFGKKAQLDFEKLTHSYHANAVGTKGSYKDNLEALWKQSN